MAKKQKRVIIAPLAWGLGHATRCMPMVEELLKLNCAVYAVLTEPQQALYAPVFGKRINIIPFDEIPVHYKGSFAVAMVRQLPRFSAQYRREQSLASWLAEKLSPDLIISDNRYGFKQFDVPSVFIGHQLRPKAGLFSPLAHLLGKRFTRGFDAIWVPDNGGEINLSGSLSHGGSPEISTTFIGPLTRFSAAPMSKKPQYNWVALLSGPEPQRSALEALITEASETLDLRLAIVAGQPEAGTAPTMRGTITRFPHLDTPALSALIADSEAIICRSGYSTLCDLAALKRRALLIPTPGQTEQEYLAKHFNQQFNFEVAKQNQVTKIKKGLAKPGAFAAPFDIDLESSLGETLHQVLFG